MEPARESRSVVGSTNAGVRTQAPTMEADDLVTLYVEFAGRLTGIVGGCVDASAAVIEDACQAAWTRLIRNRDSVAAETAPGWLLRTAVHEARRLTHLERRAQPLDREAELPNRGPGDPAAVLARRERLRTVGALPARQQRLIWLRALGFSYEEMAQLEHCTDRTVRRQLIRARRRLRAVDGLGAVSLPTTT